MANASERVCPSCRVTRLNRYSSDLLCAVCMRAVRDFSGVVPTWLWDSAPMRRVLARMDVGAMVVILRAASGLSQLDLANLVTGWSQSTVSLIERGGRYTLYDIRELVRFADSVDMPREALAPLVIGDPDATLRSDDEDVEISGVAGMDMDRRTFHGLMAGLAAPAVLPVVAIPDRVDAAHVRWLRACVQRLTDRGRTVGGRAILRQAVRYFARARAMLDDSDYSEAIGHQLLTAAVDLGQCAGWQAYDAGEQQLARRLFAEAQLLVGGIGDDQLAVRLYTNMAHQSAHLAKATQQRGLAREALRIADRAAQHARYEPSPKLRAYAECERAVAHAQLGDPAAFRAAITQARRDLDRGPHPADPPWSRYITPSEVTEYEAVGLARLGSPDQAVRLMREALDDQDQSPRQLAIYRARLAGALLEEGDRAGAIDEGSALLPDLGEQMTSVRVLNELRPVRAAAEQTAAEEFCRGFDEAARKLSAPTE